MPLTAVTACVSIWAFLHIVTKSQAIKTSFISFQSVSSFSGILNNIAWGRIMHVSTKDTFAFAALILLWDQRTEKWGLITKFSMSRCLGWFSVPACFRHLAIFITFNNSSIFHTESLEFLAICNLISDSNLDIMIGINRLPYWSDVTPSDAMPREWTHTVKRQNWHLARIFIMGDFLLIWTCKINGNNISA